MDKRYLYLGCLLIANLAIIITPLIIAIITMLIIFWLTATDKNYWVIALLSGTVIISYLIGVLIPVVIIDSNLEFSLNHENLSIAMIIIPVPVIINGLFIWLGDKNEVPDSSLYTQSD